MEAGAGETGALAYAHRGQPGAQVGSDDPPTAQRRQPRPVVEARGRREVPVENLSLGAVGVAGAGWAIAALVMLMIARGRLITPREADAMQRRIDKQDEAIVLKDATIAKFTEGIELNNDLVRAFLRVARDSAS